MGKYIVKRVLIGIITLFALATITFFLMHIIPGSPFAGETSKLPAAVKEKLIAQYGLDQPLYVQFGAYLRNALTGDFGTSLNRKGQEVVDIVANGLPATVSLGLVAFCDCDGSGHIPGHGGRRSRARNGVSGRGSRS